MSARWTVAEALHEAGGVVVLLASPLGAARTEKAPWDLVAGIAMWNISAYELGRLSVAVNDFFRHSFTREDYVALDRLSRRTGRLPHELLGLSPDELGGLS